eukprot:133198-Prorocentrum_minimum.AAC.1
MFSPQIFADAEKAPEMDIANRQALKTVFHHRRVCFSPQSGYVRMTDQSDAGSAGMFSRRTHRTQEAR